MIVCLYITNRQIVTAMFKDAMREYLQANGVAKASLCRQAKLSRPYLYAILSGESKPPTYEVQLRIADVLHLSTEEKSRFFDIAASERQEPPADIYSFYMDSSHKEEFRNRCAKEAQ